MDNKLANFYDGKVVLVTGGAGSIGSEIVRKLLQFDVKVVRVLDIDETRLFDLNQKLQSDKIRLFIGDIRDKERLMRAVEDTDIIFHAAALKHVPLCEYNPFEAVKTNVLGTQNLIEAAMNVGVEKFITVSTDKAVKPVNVLGATKLLAEKLTISANFYKGKRKTAFSCVRFGNVLGTRGSVILLFREQILNGGPVILTDTNMTRFMMSVSKAVELVLKAAEMAVGGEIFVLKMPALRIGDLADVMIENLAQKYEYDPIEIKKKVVGKRAGEKLHEELMTDYEAENAYEDGEMFIILPQTADLISKLSYMPPKNFKKTEKKEHSSQNAKLLTKEQIRSLLNELEL
jgi:FlaA1/EpsC-like NDP-sugar epimerase